MLMRTITIETMIVWESYSAIPSFMFKSMPPSSRDPSTANVGRAIDDMNL